MSFAFLSKNGEQDGDNWGKEFIGLGEGDKACGRIVSNFGFSGWYEIGVFRVTEMLLPMRTK